MLTETVCAHCAFEHPDKDKVEGAVPRESIEVRCLVFYEDANESDVGDVEMR